jgi:hypothetical protein
MELGGEILSICGAGRCTLRLAPLTKADKNSSPLLYKEETKQDRVYRNKEQSFFRGFLEKLLSSVLIK